MIIDIVKTTAKLTALVYLLTLERAVGLPLFFILLSLIWLDKNFHNEFKHLLMLAVFSLILAAAYQLGWALVLAAFIVCEILAAVAEPVIRAKNKRLLLSTLVFTLLLIVIRVVELNYFVLGQIVVSYLLIVIWLRGVERKRKRAANLDFKMIRRTNFS